MLLPVNDVRVLCRDTEGIYFASLKNRKNILQLVGNQQTEKGSVSGVPE